MVRQMDRMKEERPIHNDNKHILIGLKEKKQSNGWSKGRREQREKVTGGEERYEV